MKKVGLVGLGLMGAPMARNWLQKGFELTVLPHKNMAAASELQGHGAKVVRSLAELVENSDVIVLMVPTSREVEELTIGPEGLIRHLQTKHLVIDMSTSSPASTKKIFSRFDGSALRFFDAPVTGGVKGAQSGTLTLFIGGPVEWFEEAKEVLQAVSQTQSHFGEIGQGHVAKLINNYICIGNLNVFCEALPLAARLGLEPKRIFETLMQGTAVSEMLKVYGPQILARDFKPRFKLAHAHKDLKLAEELGQEVGATLPVLKGMLEVFESAREMGDENVSAVITVLEKELGTSFRES
jgi:2-hydroxy-3-oxopropionate reductase